ncbi:metallophosphoesterase [Planotetraspora sp. A-T 1434]|uniref:metallophosphoesterase family protein n=1 Tax=Planotetraspora sp. A-T 1434 TaxID=2979219 RepID=UPI0021C2230D|nr:metallophosphoesterase [Planotetraspora sp. A-T 1434]MCT9930190.1 metallophosphoesterase [Planotetraspora sp. A-T 1434]
MSTLYGISDLHVGYRENREIVSKLEPDEAGDWLIVAGDVAETPAAVEWALGTLAERYAKVIWSPGNHELWTTADDPVRLRGVARYEHLVRICRDLGVATPEDPYPVWDGPDGPVAVAPLFLLYDYSFLPQGSSTKEEGLEYAHGTGIVCSDEFVLHPDPYPSREAWCEARVAQTERRLAALEMPTVLVNHYPLVREPTRILRHPEFAMWCGTERTADWHIRFRAAAVVYGHLHIPRTTWHDGVRFEEVSLGYPREWRIRQAGPSKPRAVLSPRRDARGEA